MLTQDEIRMNVLRMLLPYREGKHAADLVQEAETLSAWIIDGAPATPAADTPPSAPEGLLLPPRPNRDGVPCGDCGRSLSVGWYPGVPGRWYCDRCGDARHAAGTLKEPVSAAAGCGAPPPKISTPDTPSRRNAIEAVAALLGPIHDAGGLDYVVDVTEAALRLVARAHVVIQTCSRFSFNGQPMSSLTNQTL